MPPSGPPHDPSGFLGDDAAGGQTSRTGRFRFRAARGRHLVSGSLWGLGDQALVSISGFLSTVLVARAVSPSAFGAFALSYSAIHFANSMQLAFITQPHNVLGAVRIGCAYRRYSTTTALSQAVLAASAAAIALFGAVGARTFAPGMAALLAALAVAAPGWLLHDFVRRVLYTEGRASAALAVDVVGWGLLPVVLVQLSARDALTTPRALLTAGVISVLGASLGAWFLRASFARAVDRAALRANWAFGKWLGVAMVGSAFFTYIYFFLISAVLGASAAGVVRAAQIILGPLNIVVLFLLGVLPSILARLTEPQQIVALRRRMRLAFNASAPIIVPYCIVVAIAAEPVMIAVYGSGYADTGMVLALFAAFYLCHWLAHILFAALAALERTRAVAIANLWAGAVTSSTGVPLMLTWGVGGAVAAMILGGVTLILSYWRSYLGAVRSPTPI